MLYLSVGECLENRILKRQYMHVAYVSSKPLAPYRRKEHKDGGAARLCGASSGHMPIDLHILQSWSRIGAEMAHKHVV